MSSSHPVSPTVLVTLFLLCSPVLIAQQSRIPDWLGALSIRGMELRLVVHLMKTPAGADTATLDSPDQSVNGIPVAVTRIFGDSILLDVASIAGKYAGRFVTDTLIEGKWAQGGVTLPLTLKPLREPLEIRRPQEPKKPYGYMEEEVEFRNEKENFSLAGTLTMPKGDGPFPAVVLVSGSGAQDRDEAIFNHRPFLVLADHLTRRGIAVLRYDDRGFAKSKGSRENATTLDFMEDALAAARYLKSRKEIDPGKVGMIGHSEGGIIAPMAAARTSELAFIVMMAGPGVTGDSILIHQGALVSRAAGASEEDIQRNTETQRTIFKILAEEPDTAAAAVKIREAMNRIVASLPDSVRNSADVSEEAKTAQIRVMNSAWFRFFLRYDPRNDLRKLKIPVLALIGEKDLQVPYYQNIPEIEDALKQAGNTHFIVKMIPGVNHLFQTTKTGSITEYGKIEETISPLVLREIADWIRETIKGS